MHTHNNRGSIPELKTKAIFNSSPKGRVFLHNAKCVFGGEWVSLGLFA